MTSQIMPPKERGALAPAEVYSVLFLEPGVFLVEIWPSKRVHSPARWTARLLSAFRKGGRLDALSRATHRIPKTVSVRLFLTFSASSLYRGRFPLVWEYARNACGKHYSRKLECPLDVLDGGFSQSCRSNMHAALYYSIQQPQSGNGSILGLIIQD